MRGEGLVHPIIKKRYRRGRFSVWTDGLRVFFAGLG